MRITTEQLAQQLKRTLAPLYIVYGDEPLLALEAADRIRARAREDGHAEREVLTAEQHFDWSQLKVSRQSQSLFASRRIVEIRIPSGKPGNEGSQALQDYAADLPPDTITLIALPDVDWRAQKGAWFGALDAAGVMVEAVQVKRDKLPAWLASRLKAQDQTADTETLEFIADKVEGNLLAAYQEVQKLALLFPLGALSFDQIKASVLDVARFDVFDLGGIVLSGDATHLVRVLDGLKGEGAAAPLILWSMTEEIRAIGRVLAGMAGGRPLQQAMRDARVWGPRQQLVERNVGRFNTTQIEAALVHAARIDRTIKGLARGDVWDELLQLGLRFSRRHVKAA
ncbi:MAG: polymerase subunit delta [Betaproteobacteria bacterium]|nr:polymerase subunit delta [Betaproteobacteria bacterium]